MESESVSNGDPIHVNCFDISRGRFPFFPFSLFFFNTKKPKYDLMGRSHNYDDEGKS